ncbi:MAG TPA: ScyD/ScyE family protein [Jatrophihabitans sp.]|nr:ScyD/ScyE family protein [Jatrophihabitans sp.]
MALPLCVTGTAVASAATTSPTHRVVVSGLNNPRQLSLTGEDALLIAEAGKGGDLAVISNPEEGTQTIGLTGAVSAVWAPQFVNDSTPHRVVTGLISAAAPDGTNGIGSDGVSAQHYSSIDIQETATPDGVTLPPSVEVQDGKLLRSNFTQTPTVVADIAAFERANNPDGQAVDSDPYAVLKFRDYTLVADAAGNDVLKVDKAGHVSVWRVFDNITTQPCMDPSVQQPPPNLPGCQFVPDSLAVDKQGNVYVGGLAGLVPGQGQVAKISADGRHLLHTYTGFSDVTGVAVNDSGNLYVSQLYATPSTPGVPGVLSRVTPNGTRTDTDVPFPAGVATDHFGNVYVSAYSTSPDTGLTDPSSGASVPGTSGQVWRLHW